MGVISDPRESIPCRRAIGAAEAAAASADPIRHDEETGKQERTVAADFQAQAAEDLRTADRLGARIYRALRDGKPVASDAVELACLLLDWGCGGDPVRELVERRPDDVPAQEMAGLAAALLREIGFEPGYDLVPERLTVLEHAARMVAADFAGTGVVGALDVVLQAGTDGSRAVIVMADGTGLSIGDGSPSAAGDDLPDAAFFLADEVQTEVAKRFGMVWPVCPEHRLGVHPTLGAGVAEWRCAGGGGHVPAVIGGFRGAR